MPALICMAIDSDAVDAAVGPSTLKILGDPVRWEIVRRLGVEDLCVCHLVEDLDLAQPLVNWTATVFALAALILTFGPVSGAHFNPAVTLAELATGKLEARAAAPYIGAQLAGGCAGAIIANLMFELPAVQLATKDRIS